MTTSSDELCQECKDVESLLEIDIQRLFQDLARYKGINELTDKEKLYLCLSFLGNEPIHIARKENSERLYAEIRSNNNSLTEEQVQELVEKKISDKARDVSNYLSKRVNQYIIDLMIDIDNSISTQTHRPSWLKVLCFLKNNGYKKVRKFSQQPSSKKRIVIESEDETYLKKIVDLLRMVNQKFGDGSLNVEDIESEGDEDNEQEED